MFFCGIFLVLYERVTVIELPASLGKITVQAKDSAGVNLSNSVGTVVLSEVSSAIISAVTDNNDGTVTEEAFANCNEADKFIANIKGETLPDYEKFYNDLSS